MSGCATAKRPHNTNLLVLTAFRKSPRLCFPQKRKKAADPRQAYGAMQDKVGDLVRAFRDLPGKHVYMSAKVERAQDDQGRLLYAPSMPGNKTGQALPYWFDEVFALRCETGDDGKVVRMIQTDTDGIWAAKDRSGKLDMWEPANLGAIIEKVLS